MIPLLLWSGRPDELRNSMCKGSKAKKLCEKTAEAKTEEETVKTSTNAAKKAKFEEELAARSPPTVYRPDYSSERALAKIPEIGSSAGLKSS